MNASPHLLLALSGHGYGHLAQSAPVINAVRAQLPGLRVTVCSPLPRAVIAGRLVGPFSHRRIGLDVVLPMKSAWEVDVAAARLAFAQFHLELDAGLARDVELLGDIKPDLVLANIPYRILTAARRAGIPAVALCSLNWASIYAAYCGADDASATILQQMWNAYRAGAVFLAPAPSLEMPALDRYRAIGPIARLGVPQSAAVLERLGLAAGTRLVMVALGGIATTLPLANWPRLDKVAWLFTTAIDTPRDDVFDAGVLPQTFIDVLASADAVLTKPGYGTYAEAVCNGVPLLSLSRPDWPETVYLNAWARHHGRVQEISKQQFESGEFATALQQLWLQPAPKQVPEPLGIAQAAGVLLEWLQPAGVG